MKDLTFSSCRVAIRLAVIGLGFIFTASSSLGFSVDVTQAPRNELFLTIKTIREAKQSVFLNVYEMKSQDVADALIDRVRAGVHVEILEEGQPFGGENAQTARTRAELVAAMQEAPPGNTDHFFVMHSSRPKSRRFHYDHAKYIVVDDESLLIGSENYSASLTAPQRKPGNRGWEALVHRPELARDYRAMFKADADPTRGDIEELVDSGKGRSFVSLGAAAPLVWSEGFLKQGHSVRIPDGALATFDAARVKSITSPDSSERGLTDLLDSARQSIDLELMGFNIHWGRQSSPLFDSLLAAARRGVRVRVLLNDERVFAHHDAQSWGYRVNPLTVEAITQIASDEGLDLQARIANLDAMNVTYIHNKGALVDDDKTLISSINWDRNAVMFNREAAVVLQSEAINQYYRELFKKDWEAR